MGILAGMRISLVIAAHNEEARIAQCLDSIQKALGTHTGNTELIVVANACTDRTAEIARGCTGVRVVEEPVKGLSKTRDTGFRASTGELVAHLDADIIMSETWLPFVLDAFARDPELVALSGPYIYYDLPILSRALVKVFYGVGYIVYLFTRFVLKKGSMLQGGNFVVRRTALEKVGGFDTSITFYGEDTDIARRLFRVGKVRWTFRLPMKTSGRRLQQEGLIRTGLRYAVNFFSTTFAGTPYTNTHKDIRTDV